MTPDRETRLRQRIDQLTEQRDHAQAQADRRGRLVKKWRDRAYDLKKSRDLAWHRLRNR